MIRTTLLVLFAICYLILTLPALFVIWIISNSDSARASRIATAMIRWAFRVLGRGAGTEVTVIGTERIPTDGTVLYVGNHRSIFDIILSHPHMTGVTGFVAKDSLGKVPIFSIWCRYIGCLFFDRDSTRDGIRMIRDGIEKLETGTSLFIFPEGTRNKAANDLPLLPFHEGSFRIATKSGRPIVPVAISNCADVWEAHSPAVRKTHVVIEFCEPIDPTALSRAEQKQLGARASACITEAMSNHVIKAPSRRK